jgi:hypothetical protein
VFHYLFQRFGFIFYFGSYFSASVSVLLGSKLQMSYFLAFGKIMRMQSLNGELLELL